MKIVSTFVLSAAQRKLIADACPGADLADPTRVAERKARQSMFDSEVMAPHFADCDVLLTYTMPKDLVARAPRLKWIHCMAAGLDSVLRTGMFDHRTIVLTATLTRALAFPASATPKAASPAAGSAPNSAPKSSRCRTSSWSRCR